MLFATIAGTRSPKYCQGERFLPSTVSFTEMTPLTLRGPKLPYTELTCLAPQIPELSHRMYPDGVSCCQTKGAFQVLKGPDTLIPWLALGWHVCV